MKVIFSMARCSFSREIWICPQNSFFDLVLVQKCVKNYSWALFEKLLFQDTSIFAVFSIFNLSRSKQKIFRKFFLSLFLEFWALQTLKVSSKSVTTSVSVVDFMWKYPLPYFVGYSACDFLKEGHWNELWFKWRNVEWHISDWSESSWIELY